MIFGIDETIERRRGQKIKAKGIYRDPVRSSKSHMVKCSGLRWMSLMLLSPISWALVKTLDGSGEAAALLSTNLNLSPREIIIFFIRQ